MNQENVVFVQNGILLSQEEELNNSQINGWNWRKSF
jgi:hypothetical protein